MLQSLSDGPAVLVMPRFSFALAAAVLVGLAGCDTAAPADDLDTTSVPLEDASPIVHRVTVGTNDFNTDPTDPQPDDANFSASIVEFANGVIRGMHNDVVRGDTDGDGEPDTTYSIRGTVNCLRVVGNTAYWSGTITSRGSNEGLRFLSAARDLGTSQQQPTDQISYTYIFAATSSRTCQAPGFTLPFFDIVNGQVRIR